MTITKNAVISMGNGRIFFDISVDKNRLIVYRRFAMRPNPIETRTAIPAGKPVADRLSDASLELASMCKALGHPVRIRILEHLKAVEGCICGQIAAVFPLAQSTVSQHLKILKEAGLVKGEVEGPRTCYCLDREKLTRLKALIAGL